MAPSSGPICPLLTPAPTHPVASAPHEWLAGPEVRLGGNGPAGQSSGGAGQVSGAGCYVQPHRGGMEPRDAFGVSTAPEPPIESGAPRCNHPFFPCSREGPRLRNPGHRCIPGHTRASSACPQTTALGGSPGHRSGDPGVGN